MRSITFIRKNLTLFSKAHSGPWTGICQTQGAQWTTAAARAGCPCSHHLPAFPASSAGLSADSPDGLHFHRKPKGLMGERTLAEGTEIPSGSLVCFLAGCQGRSWQQAACLVCCTRITTSHHHTLTSTLIYFAPASVPVLLSPFFSFKALEGGEGTRQLAGGPCKEQEGRSLKGKRWALLLSVDLRREDRVVGSKRPPEPRTP